MVLPLLSFLARSRVVSSCLPDSFLARPTSDVASNHSATSSPEPVDIPLMSVREIMRVSEELDRASAKKRREKCKKILDETERE